MLKVNSFWAGAEEGKLERSVIRRKGFVDQLFVF